VARNIATTHRTEIEAREVKTLRAELLRFSVDSLTRSGLPAGGQMVDAGV
jgi:hypothetical protein